MGSWGPGGGLRISEAQSHLLVAWKDAGGALVLNPRTGKFGLARAPMVAEVTRATVVSLKRQGVLRYQGSKGREMLSYEMTAKGQSVAKAVAM